MLLLDKTRTIAGSTVSTTIEVNNSSLRGLFLLKLNEISEPNDGLGTQSSISTTITKDELIKLRDSIDLMVNRSELN